MPDDIGLLVARSIVGDDLHPPGPAEIGPAAFRDREGARMKIVISMDR